MEFLSSTASQLTKRPSIAHTRWAPPANYRVGLRPDRACPGAILLSSSMRRYVSSADTSLDSFLYRSPRIGEPALRSELSLDLGFSSTKVAHIVTPALSTSNITFTHGVFAFPPART